MISLSHSIVCSFNSFQHMQVSVGVTIEMLLHRFMLHYNCSSLPPILFLNLHHIKYK